MFRQGSAFVLFHPLGLLRFSDFSDLSDFSVFSVFSLRLHRVPKTG
jgi:hypothetical protein